MPAAIPQHIREQIVRACDEGVPRESILRKYEVSSAFVRRLLQRRREHGHYERKPHAGGRSPAISGKRLKKLRALVHEHPDATVAYLCKKLGKVSTAGVCRALKRHGLTLKVGRYRQTTRGVFRSPLRQPVFKTRLGRLYEADCMDILPGLKDESIDMVFADAPFNLKKCYGRRGTDSRPEAEYLDWCRAWLDQCVRVLKPGGTILLYHIPRTAMRLGCHLLDCGLTLHNWIAVDINLGMAIRDRLTPRHYALLYASKGARPATFNTLRLPIQTCRHCGGDLKDYGGHRDQVHPDGVRLTDVWTDISAVRHDRHRHRAANHLSEKLVERCIAMTTTTQSTVLDVFGGAGTIPAVCERLNRRWIATEIESVEGIVDRLSRRPSDPCRTVRGDRERRPLRGQSRPTPA